MQPAIRSCKPQENGGAIPKSALPAMAEGLGVKAVCVVTDEGDGVLEIKNLAVDPAHHRKGYGRAMLDHIAQIYAQTHHTLQLGTGDSPLTVPFYENCGFKRAHIVPNFFVENYDHPIYEDGVQLVDMVYFAKKLG